MTPRLLPITIHTGFKGYPNLDRLFLGIRFIAMPVSMSVTHCECHVALQDQNNQPHVGYFVFSFSQAEVDALIDMVSALKEERDKYKLKYRQLSASTTPVTPVLTSPLSQMILSGRISAGAWTLNPKTSEGYRYGSGGGSSGTTPGKCACVSGSNVLNPASTIAGSIAHGLLSPAGSTIGKSVLSSRASTASTYVTSSRGTTPGELHSDLLWPGLMTSPHGSKQQQLQQQLQQQASRRPSSLHWDSRQYPGTAPYTARNMNVLVYI
jgi:hypothetical protein